MTAGTPDREVEFRAYLLGALPPDRQEEIDERFLADEDLHAELQATADDLIQAYLSGQLSAEDRERFETHFLASPRRRERVAFVRSLVTAVDRVRRPRYVRRHSDRAPCACSPGRPCWSWPWAWAVGLSASGAAANRSGRRRSSARTALQRQLLAHEARVRELEGRGAASDEPQIATWTLSSGVERGPGGRGRLHRSRRLDSPARGTRARPPRQRLPGPSPNGRRPRDPAPRWPAGSHRGPRDRGPHRPRGPAPPRQLPVSIQRDAPGRADELTVTTFVVR